MQLDLRVSDRLSIYGANGWEKWPEFSPYYRGFVSDEDEIASVFSTTKINIQNGELTFHLRIVDCMATGGFRIIQKKSTTISRPVSINVLNQGITTLATRSVMWKKSSDDILGTTRPVE